MLIHEFSSFYNENLIADLKVTENSSWVDFFHFSESDRDFRFNPKDFNYSGNSSQVLHYQINGKKEFHHDHYRLTKSIKLVRKVRTDPWENDKRQRNFAIDKFHPKDDDILIFSDIDEIIDSRKYVELLEATKSRGIITIKLHYTLYYFNLFSKNWAGPPDYSYRVFLMTGNYYNSNNVNSDELRKAGERGDLMNSIYCYPEHGGFHHSWLGNEKEALKKIQAYPHASFEHDSNLYSSKGEIIQENLANLIRSGKSVYGEDHVLEIRNDIQQLSSVEMRRNADLKAYCL